MTWFYISSTQVLTVTYFDTATPSKSERKVASAAFFFAHIFPEILSDLSQHNSARLNAPQYCAYFEPSNYIRLDTSIPRPDIVRLFRGRRCRSRHSKLNGRYRSRLRHTRHHLHRSGLDIIHLYLVPVSGGGRCFYFTKDLTYSHWYSFFYILYRKPCIHAALSRFAFLKIYATLWLEQEINTYNSDKT